MRLFHGNEAESRTLVESAACIPTSDQSPALRQRLRSLNFCDEAREQYVDGLGAWSSSDSAAAYPIVALGLQSETFSAKYFSESPEKQLIASQVRQLLAKCTAVDVRLVYPDDDLSEVRVFELDSLGAEEFVVNLEREFGCKISDEDAQGLKTLRQIIDYIAEQK